MRKFTTVVHEREYCWDDEIWISMSTAAEEGKNGVRTKSDVISTNNKAVG